MAVAPGLNKITFTYIDVNTNYAAQSDILVANINAINNQIYNVLSCLMGEVDYEPELGALLDYYLFEQNSMSTDVQIQMLLYFALNTWLSGRIFVSPQNVTFAVDMAAQTLTVTIIYTYLLTDTGIRLVLVLPIVH